MSKKIIAELERAKEVRKRLSTKKLKVEDFASLHDDVVDLLQPLLNDGMMSAVATKYTDAVNQLHTLKTDIKNVTSKTGAATKTLKALKKEISIFAGIVKRAKNSQSAASQAIAKSIYDEYHVALNGQRLNVINAKDIIKVFVAKLAKLDQAAIKAAGYEDYVKFITTQFNTYTTQHTVAMKSQENRSTLTKQIIEQRSVIEGTYQMMIMMLVSLEYCMGDKNYTTILNAIMLRVSSVKASQKANETKAANRADGDGKGNEDPTPDPENKKPAGTEGVPDPNPDPTPKADPEKDPANDPDNEDETKLPADPVKTTEGVLEGDPNPNEGDDQKE